MSIDRIKENYEKALIGNIDWQDEDNVKKQIRNIPGMVSKDTKYQNAMKNSD